MFEIARQGLVDMATYIPAYRGAASRPDKFCHGFGIFQLDLQFFKTDPDYFLSRRYADFDAALARCVGELKSALKRIGWQAKTSLSDAEMAGVAIAYNTGRYDPAKGLKQGYFDGSKYYGENYYAYLQLAKGVRFPAAEAAPSRDARALPAAAKRRASRPRRRPKRPQEARQACQEDGQGCEDGQVGQEGGRKAAKTAKPRRSVRPAKKAVRAAKKAARPPTKVIERAKKWRRRPRQRRGARAAAAIAKRAKATKPASRRRLTRAPRVRPAPSRSARSRPRTRRGTCRGTSCVSGFFRPPDSSNRSPAPPT